ncbi:MAG: hypothetical protein EVG15_04040 [Candidatus Acididesulfobacter diazotrophicus]|jgi:mRNA-degrading endonuclease RelE of RelBE toxin-antitoxin system|uniref:Type II toxin-antitoxin system RelE/ParE family toxin n=1 Tax=Candidatus Acididesulfobacter diazotrophicus TaxID=2597226 RepID=A0A519BNB3_9DELT|nr:MAG: hypothetical protein EVG15_04040 [Candidatus Acididesulfobacter diazotrophicus]
METAYDVLFTANAEKDLLSLKKLKESALDKIMDLKQNPLKGHMLKGSLNGVRALKFSIKGVAYRAAYIVIEEDRVCLVFMIGPHEGFYEKAQGRAKIFGI